MKLTSRERILRIFRGEEIDRPALKLWGAGPVGKQLHPAYLPVSRLAAETTDIFASASSPFDIYCGANAPDYVEVTDQSTADPLWLDRHTTFHTPAGDLHQVERISTVGEPPYITEYLVKEPEDLPKLLSLPYAPYPFDRSEYDRLTREVGDRGVVMLNLDHAGYALQRLVGSENLAYFSIDCRDALDEVIRVFSARIREFVRMAIDAGVRGPCQWVGPEVFIPPLLSPKDFEDFVFRYDQPLCADIHNAGGSVWVHCHGKVASFIERYIAMGVDILNPLEPPKNGDVSLPDIAAAFRGRIGLEGNIEIQQILQAEPDDLREQIRACVEAGQSSGRFILCPSAGYMEYPFPSDAYIRNLLLYLTYGLECVECCRQ